MEVDPVVIKLIADVKKYRFDVSNATRLVDQRLDAQGRSVQRLEKQFKVSSDRMASTARGLAGTFAGTFAAMFSATTLTSFARSVVDTTQKFRGFQQALTITAGSSEAAGKEMAYVAEVADRIGFKVTDLTGAFVGLSAAARGTALEGQRTRDIFEALTSASAAYGLTNAQLEGAMLAVQQMISKGTVAAEELRGQLGERLPGAFQIAARAMGVTTSELGKMLEQGEIVADDFLPKFAAQLSREIPAGTRAAGAGFARLANEWDKMLVTMGDAGFFDAIAQGAAELGNVVRDLADEGSFRKIGDDLKFIIGVAAEGVGALQKVANLLNAIANNPKNAGYDLPSVLDRALGTGGKKGAAGSLSLEDTLRNQLANDEALFPKLGKGSAIADQTAKRIDIAKSGLKAIEGQKVLELKTALERVNAGIINVSKAARGKLEADLQDALATYNGTAPAAPETTAPARKSDTKAKAAKETPLERYQDTTDYRYERLQEINDFVKSTKEIELANVRIGKTISFTDYLAESFEEVADIVDGDVRLAFEGLIKQQAELEEAAEDFARTFAGAFEDAILSGNLDGAFKGLLEDLSRLIIRLTIIEPLAKSVADALKDAGAGGKGGLFGGLISGIGSLFGGQKNAASGTNFAHGGIYRVGESGPETVMLPRGSRVMPATQTAAMGKGPATVTQVLQLDLKGAVLTHDLLKQMNTMAHTAAVGGAMAGSQDAQQNLTRRSRNRIP